MVDFMPADFFCIESGFGVEHWDTVKYASLSQASGPHAEHE